MATVEEKLMKLLMKDDKWKSTLFGCGQRMNTIRGMQHDLARVFRTCALEYAHVKHGKGRDWVRQVVIPQFPKWYLYENGLGYVEPTEEILITKIQQRLRSERKEWSSKKQKHNDLVTSRHTRTKTTAATTKKRSTGSKKKAKSTAANGKKRSLVDRDISPSMPSPMEIESFQKEHWKQQESNPHDTGSEKEPIHAPATLSMSHHVDEKLAEALISMDETISHLCAQVEEQGNRLDQLYETARRKCVLQMQEKEEQEQQQEEEEEQQRHYVKQPSPYNEGKDWQASDWSSQDCWTPFPMPWE